jgi:hypothetical protein
VRNLRCTWYTQWPNSSKIPFYPLPHSSPHPAEVPEVSRSVGICPQPVPVISGGVCYRWRPSIRHVSSLFWTPLISTPLHSSILSTQVIGQAKDDDDDDSGDGASFPLVPSPSICISTLASSDSQQVLSDWTLASSSLRTERSSPCSHDELHSYHPAARRAS